MPTSRSARYLFFSVLFFLAPSDATSACKYLELLIQAGHFPKEGHGTAETHWDYDGPRTKHWEPTGQMPAKKSYEISFEPILKRTGELSAEDFFENWIQKRIKNKKTAHVLDLFGSGYFVEDRKAATSVTGLRWGPYGGNRWNASEGNPNMPKPVEVLGDITNLKTWAALDQSKKDRSIPSFDLVVMHPVGGWSGNSFGKTPEGTVLALSHIISNVHTRLSPDGRFYFDLHLSNFPPDLAENPTLLELAREISEHSNHKLILLPDVTGGKMNGLSGALIPKSP